MGTTHMTFWHFPQVHFRLPLSNNFVSLQFSQAQIPPVTILKTVSWNQMKDPAYCLVASNFDAGTKYPVEMFAYKTSNIIKEQC